MYGRQGLACHPKHRRKKVAYLDSAGNVNYTDPTQGQVGANWQAFERQKLALSAHSVRPSTPGTALPSGAEKAERGHD